MTRIHLPAAILTAFALTVAAHAGNDYQTGERVVMSAVVVNDDGAPVRGLTAADFSVRDDGDPVAITGFSATNSADAAVKGRSIVLLLGGQGGDHELTKRYQQIGQAFFARATAADSISVVRMSDSHDEVAGSRPDMLMRLAEFRAPYGEPFNAKTTHEILDRIARISREFPDSPTRKAIVCIGPSYVFDVVEPPLKKYELIWPHWVSAITATAQANASVYAIDPKAMNGRIRLNPDGLVRTTGGTYVDDSNEYKEAVERVWIETGNYYTFEYMSSASRHELQSIDVKVNREDVHVHARRKR